MDAIVSSRNQSISSASSPRAVLSQRHISIPGRDLVIAGFHGATDSGTPANAEHAVTLYMPYFVEEVAFYLLLEPPVQRDESTTASTWLSVILPTRPTHSFSRPDHDSARKRPSQCLTSSSSILRRDSQSTGSRRKDTVTSTQPPEFRPLKALTVKYCLICFFHEYKTP